MRIRNIVVGCAASVFLVTGCTSTLMKTRLQTIQVSTDPPGAQVWVWDKNGKRRLGSSPVFADSFYDVVTEKRYYRWGCLVPSFGVVGFGAGLMLYGVFRYSDDPEALIPRMAVGSAVLLIGGLALFVSSVIGLASPSVDEKALDVSEMRISATLPGYETAFGKVSIPGDDAINLVLQKKPGKVQEDSKVHWIFGDE